MAYSQQAKATRLAVSDFKVNTGKSATTIGEAKTGGFNMETPIISEAPVSTVITETIRQGFRKQGVDIVASGDGVFSLDGTIEQFWVDEYATGFSLEYAKARIKYDLYLKNPQGKIVWVKSVEKFKASSKSMDATHDDVPTLLAVLEESVKDVIDDAGFWNALKK